LAGKTTAGIGYFFPRVTPKVERPKSQRHSGDDPLRLESLIEERKCTRDPERGDTGNTRAEEKKNQKKPPLLSSVVMGSGEKKKGGALV